MAKRQQQQSPFNSPQQVGMGKQQQSPFHSPPQVRRRLDSESPIKEKKNLTGYLLIVGEDQIAKKGNAFFDIKLEIRKKDFVNVRVMKMGLASTFTDKIGSAIRLQNVSNTDSGGIMFYNEKYGAKLEIHKFVLPFGMSSLHMTKVGDVTEDTCNLLNISGALFWLDEGMQETSNGAALRNAILKDEEGEMKITIWKEPLIQSVKTGQWLTLTDLSTAVWNTLKLQTSRSTIMQFVSTKSKKIIGPDMKSYQREGAISIENPKILSVIITPLKVCVGIQCQNPFIPEEHQEFTRCMKCGRKQLIAQMLSRVDGTIDIDCGFKQITLSMGKNIIESVTSVEDIDQAEERFCKLSNITLVYDEKSLKVIAIDSEDEERSLLDSDQLMGISKEIESSQ